MKLAETFKGSIDKIEDGIISGWVYNENNIKKKVKVQALVNNILVGEGNADNFRVDLQRAKIGDLTTHSE